MGWLKWIVVLVISLIFPPFFPIYLIYKYAKFLIVAAVKMDLIFIYLLIRTPIWLGIEIPLHLAGITIHTISTFFSTALGFISRHRKFYGGGMAIFLILYFLTFTPSSLSEVGSALSTSLVTFLFLAIPAFIVSGIYAWYSGAKKGVGGWPKSPVRKKGEEAAGAAAGKAAAGAQFAADNAGTGKKVYKDLKSTGKIGTKGKFPMPSDMLNALSKVPIVGGTLKSRVQKMGTNRVSQGAAKAGAKVGKSAAARSSTLGKAGTAAGSVGAATFFYVLLGAIVIGAIFLVIQFMVVMAFAGAAGVWLSSVLGPLILGPLGAAAGLGGEYANWGEEVFGTQLVGIDLSDEFAVYGQARARVFCLLKGPACLRQWRLNNTQRPGSDEVGETYGLKIDRFEIGQGQQIDVSYQSGEYTMPVSFTLSNPRHGLKGIDAKNVNFRIKIIDTDRGEDNPYCDTGWIDVPNAYNVDDDSLQDDIYPGTSASTGFLEIVSDSSSGDQNAITAPKDGLTLEECGMLQPALGDQRVAILKVKYDYFSQATLYFDAMSRETLQSDPNIQKKWKNSKTADTPVKAAINVNSPVIFNQDMLGTDNAAQPFAVRATLNTDKSDVEYTVNEFRVENSRFVEGAEAGRSCQFESESGGTIQPGDTLTLTPEAAENMINGTDPTRNANYYWFNQNRKPPIAGCVLRLEGGQLGSISPTGETLSMGVESTYTVAKRFRMGSFKVFRSQCSRINCPLIVTLQQNRSGTYTPPSQNAYNFLVECRGLDAGNGCSVVNADNLMDGELAEQPLNAGTDQNIESGELAVELSGFGVAGIDRRDWEEIDQNMDGNIDSGAQGFVIYQYTTREGRLDVTYEPTSDCSQSEWQQSESSYTDILQVIEFRSGEDCTSSGGGGSGGSGGGSTSTSCTGDTRNACLSSGSNCQWRGTMGGCQEAN